MASAKGWHQQGVWHSQQLKEWQHRGVAAGSRGGSSTGQYEQGLVAAAKNGTSQQEVAAEDAKMAHQWMASTQEVAAQGVAARRGWQRQKMEQQVVAAPRSDINQDWQQEGT
jgi:hypothetical protein